MDWEPNVEGLKWFIEKVWPTIHLRFPQITLHLAGRNMSDEFKAIKAPQVIIQGEIDDATQFILEHDIMVVPILSGGGVRVKIIEGMALGKAIISSTIGAIGIDYKEKDNILIADSTSEWIQAIDSLISKEGKKERLENNARQFAETHFDNRIITKELIQFYKEVQK
jgi:glycosyltransferase involved in cell wall biosynthesis